MHYNSSTPKYLTNVSGTLFFTANDGIHGPEIWSSDGSSAGTKMVREISSGTATYGVDQPQRLWFLTNVNGTLYFSGFNESTGTELWRSDGTSSGTFLVREINPTGFATPHFLINVGGTLYFTANDGVKG